MIILILIIVTTIIIIIIMYLSLEFRMRADLWGSSVFNYPEILAIYTYGCFLSRGRFFALCLPLLHLPPLL
jgi:hypothetical protein